MIGTELVEDKTSRTPLAPEKVMALAGTCLSRGVMMVPCGRYGNVLRVMPSLTIPRSLLLKALDIFGQALAEV
jgi:4-aminobutyrate aminotransferase